MADTTNPTTRFRVLLLLGAAAAMADHDRAAAGKLAALAVGDRAPAPDEAEALLREEGVDREALADEVAQRTIRELRRQLGIQSKNNAARNLALDALAHVWCAGGCEKGVLRAQGAPGAAVIAAAARNTARLIEWWANAEARRRQFPEWRDLPYGPSMRRAIEALGGVAAVLEAYARGDSAGHGFLDAAIAGRAMAALRAVTRGAEVAILTDHDRIKARRPTDHAEVQAAQAAGLRVMPVEDAERIEYESILEENRRLLDVAKAAVLAWLTGEASRVGAELELAGYLNHRGEITRAGEGLLGDMPAPPPRRLPSGVRGDAS